MPPEAGLSGVRIVLHWAIAAGILAMIAFGLVVSATPAGPQKAPLVSLHKSLGVVLGFLALFRVLIHFREGFPKPTAGISRLKLLASRLVQSALLFATIALPLTGIAKSITYARTVDVFGVTVFPRLLEQKDDALNEIASSLHLGFGILVLMLVAIHAGAALHHHVVHRDRTLSRMLGLATRKV